MMHPKMVSSKHSISIISDLKKLANHDLLGGQRISDLKKFEKGVRFGRAVFVRPAPKCRDPGSTNHDLMTE